MAVGRRAIAATAGTFDGVANGSFYMAFLSQSPGQVITVRTSNLTPGGDTVLHVQNEGDPQGGFIAGDDDSGGGWSSLVVVPSPASARTLRVVVRSYSEAYQGKCDVVVTDNLGTNLTIATQVDFGGSVTTLVGSMQAGARVTTGELQGGSNDTVMLVLSSTTHAVAFDDDDGVANMSWVQLGTGCSVCTVVLANYAAGQGSQATRLVWDEEAITQDVDQDGLGVTLEGILGTNPNSFDSDQDGITDRSELVGMDVFSGSTLIGSVKFPFMGADPTKKDLFLEVDWVACTDPACGGDINKGQLTETQTNLVQANFNPVRLHWDTGRNNTYTDSRKFDWGNWGGASRLPETPVGQTPVTEGHSLERDFKFHHVVSYGTGYGQSPKTPGGCFAAWNQAETLRHELGHNMGLLHGGRPGKVAIRYKPQYYSFMNYAYQTYAPAFSSNANSSVVLNPTALDERAGVGNNAVMLDKIKEYWCPGNVPTACVNDGTVSMPGVPLGAVDWNRDGAFAPAGTFVQGTVALKDFSNTGQSTFSTSSLFDTSMSWVSVGGSIGDQLWILGHSSGGALQYAKVSRTSINSTCGASFFTSYYDEQNFDCAGINAGATLAPGARSAGGAPGLAEINNKLIAVWAPANGTIRSSIITIDPSTGAVTMATDVTLPGNVVPSGDVTALSTAPGVVTAWAQSSGRLKEWVYQNNAWSGPIDQEWADGAGGFIVPLFGIGATRGYEGTTQSTYAAIVRSPDNVIEFARKEASGPQAGKWTRLSASWSIFGSQPVAASRPGLAFQHTAGQAASVGRFYAGFTQQTCMGKYGSSPCPVLLLMTEGNTANSTQRLKWLTPAQNLGTPGNVRGIALIDDPARDTNLRASYTDAYNYSYFLPLADGIMNATMRDNDDWPYVLGALRASLSLDDCIAPGCTWPAGVLPASLP
jgi:hypothetical protein